MINGALIMRKYFMLDFGEPGFELNLFHHLQKQ